MKFESIPEFDKDLKKLQKRFRSLSEDLEVVKKVLIVCPNERAPFSFRLEGLGLDTCMIKVKKIACKSLKGRGVNSGLRLVYAHFEAEEKIVMVELYHKSDKPNEDRERIRKSFSWITEPEL